MSTILLVEDSLTEANIMARCLQEAGLRVVTVYSGEDAQAHLACRVPDLILLDVILPGQSGFELCRSLKADPRTGCIPVVLCSTKGTNADQIWGQMLGADAYLSKPVDRQILVQTIQKLISSKSHG
ncbi:MAG: response regulator [Synechococcales bacterium]|nr:response regulator [Synechococcales bacterium]